MESPVMASPKSHPDEMVLRTIYRVLRGDEWYDNSGWDTHDDYCAWYGVQCDGDGFVVQLMLYGNNLRGELSAVPSLGNLSRITFLGMHNNELSGRFPEAIEAEQPEFLRSPRTI